MGPKCVLKCMPSYTAYRIPHTLGCSLGLLISLAFSLGSVPLLLLCCCYVCFVLFCLCSMYMVCFALHAYVSLLSPPASLPFDAPSASSYLLLSPSDSSHPLSLLLLCCCYVCMCMRVCMCSPPYPCFRMLVLCVYPPSLFSSSAITYVTSPPYPCPSIPTCPCAMPCLCIPMYVHICICTVYVCMRCT